MDRTSDGVEERQQKKIKGDSDEISKTRQRQTV